jgi:bifunctional UDP-N-acetylglucosamine pyrophosphorylase/glucosamine-1-phosphate N-acetyltransferase
MSVTTEVAQTEIGPFLQGLSSPLDYSKDDVAIILAAGHGKRIKSLTSKMLHEIWGVPTVERVSNAARKGLGSNNQILVVGIMAQKVAAALGKSEQRLFVLQEEQNGTGDAVRAALEGLQNGPLSVNTFIFPGDMGLLTSQAVKQFKSDFQDDPCDMMVLTGMYEGDPAENYYGRILRVPDRDTDGRSSSDDVGKVIEIKENKDIHALGDDALYKVIYRGREYGFTKSDLVNINEFNTGVFAFKADKLQKYIGRLETNNVQKELYLTDLISIFYQNGLTVKAAKAKDNRTVLGFNVKSVLKEMENFAREDVYEQLKDLIYIADRDDFFVSEEVVERLIELDRTASPLDIHLGKGVHIGKHVHLNKGVRIKTHAHLSGNIVLGEGVEIDENVHLSAYPEQTLKVGKNSRILKADIVKGNIEIGENCEIESSVNMTGSDDHPTRIGNNVEIKGTSYVFGCTIEDDVKIEHSVLKFKHITRVVGEDGRVQPVRFFLPEVEGLHAVQKIASNGKAKS